MKIPTLLLAGITTVAAQSGGPWIITAFTLDSGGQQSSGGQWSVISAIGQPDATAQNPSGGVWSLQGGFRPGIVVEPGGPLLTMTPLGTASVSLAWPAEAAGHKLQFSTDLTNWSDYPDLTITGAASISWNLNSGPRYYFRLHKSP